MHGVARMASLNKRGIFMCAGPMGQCHPIPDSPALREQMLRAARNYQRVYNMYNLPFQVRRRCEQGVQAIGVKRACIKGTKDCMYMGVCKHCVGVSWNVLLVPLTLLCCEWIILPRRWWPSCWGAKSAQAAPAQGCRARPALLGGGCRALLRPFIVATNLLGH